MSQRLPAALSGLLLGLSLALAPGLALAQAQAASELAPPQFADAAEQARFHTLTSELRCVMCQNQSLADSNAQIARDMRREVLSLMREGHDDAQIKRFLVDRYGEFVLYRPPVSARNALLWAGPFALLAIGGLVWWRLGRRPGQDGPDGRDEPGRTDGRDRRPAPSDHPSDHPSAGTGQSAAAAEAQAALKRVDDLLER